MKKQLLSLIFALPFLANAQFSESFDSGIPATWTIINGGDSGQTWASYSSYSALTTINPHSGAKFVGLRYGSTAHSDYLISPQVTVQAGVSDKLALWAVNGSSSTFLEKFDIKISTTTPDASAFTKTLASAVAPPTSWNRYTYDLSEYVGQTIYIGFYSSTTDLWFVGLDDIVVSNAATLSVIDTKDNKLNVYPNPVENYLNINVDSKSSTANIINVAGQQIKIIKLTAGENKVNFTDLPKGNYIVRVEDEGQSKSYRIIKK